MRSHSSKQLRRGRIVGGADRVDAHVHHDFELPLHGARVEGAAQAGRGRGAGSRPAAARGDR